MAVRNVWPTLALLVVSLAVSLVLGELVLRVALPFDRKQGHYMRARNVFQFDASRVRYDPLLGYANRPDLTVEFSNREFRTRVRTNSEGYRDDEASLRDPDVLLLGDSFGFGWGVEEAEGLEKQLERLSGGRVLNLSVSGYGTLQQVLQLERLAATRDLTGATAVFAFYPNDLDDYTVQPRGGDPIVDLTLDGRGMASRGVEEYEEWLAGSRAKLNRGIFRVSYVADLTRQLARRIGREVASALERFGVGTESGPELEDDHFVTFEATLARLRRLAEAESLRVVFAYVPTIRDLDGSSDPELLAGVERAVRAAGFEQVDLRDALAPEDYFPYDAHWRASGHRRAAAAIHAFLEGGGPSG